MANEKLEKLSVLINNFAYSCIRFGEIHKDKYYSGTTILSQARDMMDLNKEVLFEEIKKIIDNAIESTLD